MKGIIMRRYHEGYGHPAGQRMYETIFRKYWWNKMMDDIESYASSCLQCQRRKAAHNKQAPIQVYEKTMRPFQRCHIDLTGPFVKTDRGMQYILIFKDSLTKWVEIFALPDKSAESVAECLFDEILMRHGSPEVLISDQGTEFVNKIVKQLMKLLKVRRVTTSPYSPRADGLAEKAVGTFKDMLSAYINIFQNNWDNYLAIVANYYRTTVNAATKFTPYYMMYGRECTQPDELWIGKFTEALNDQQNIDTVEDYVRDMAESMKIIRELIGEQLFSNSKKVATRRNSTLKLRTFNVGDKVYVEKGAIELKVKDTDDNTEHKIKSAFRDRYEGPYEIVKKIGALTYVLQVKNRRPYYNISQLKGSVER
jgi:transposase InsO family protein